MSMQRNQVNLIKIYEWQARPEIADSKLGSLFHTTKMWVGTSHSSIVAKDPIWVNSYFLNWENILTLPAHNQSFIVVPGIVAHGTSIEENTSFIENVSNLGRWMLQRYFPYWSWGQWHCFFHLFIFWDKTWRKEHKDGQRIGARISWFIVLESKANIVLTLYKAVDPFGVWKHRVPNTVTIHSVKDTVISSPVQGGM